LNRSTSILTLDQLLQLPHWEVVVAGVRNSRRVLEITGEQLSNRPVFESSLAQAEAVIRGHSPASSLEPHCEAAYRAAAQVAARNRVAAGLIPELVAAAHSIHLSIDAVTDFEMDSYESVCTTYLALKSASRLQQRSLIQNLGHDLGLIVTFSARLLPTDQILDAFGPLWISQE
jgi:hypothetical protein